MIDKINNGDYMEKKIVTLISEHHSDPPEKTRHSGRALIIKDDKILLSHEINTNIYMSPGGGLENDESLEECVIRELKEEVGATAEKVIPLGRLYPTVAYDTEVIYMYLATGLSFSEQKLDEDEFLDVVRMPLSEAVEMVMQDKIHDAKTVVAVLKAARLMQD